MPPVVLFVGTGKVGKTTFIEKLIPELVGRGYRLATIKHTVHQTSFDRPDKDTARHIKAGSAVTAIASPSEFVMLAPGGYRTVADMIRHLGDDFDLVIAEGFKHEKGPKIEVHRRTKGEALAGHLEEVVAVITDEPLNLNIRQFSLDDIKGVASFIEEAYIKPQRRRLTLFINNEPVTLGDFPRKLASRLVAATAVACNRTEDEIRSLDISLRL